jgi:hypothetical protein
MAETMAAICVSGQMISGYGVFRMAESLLQLELELPEVVLSFRISR